jgi:gliding motility-associated-like protein
VPIKPYISCAQIDLPDPPVFLSASVASGIIPDEVDLLWEPSDSLDVEGYIIYQVLGGVTETIDTVYGRLNNQYSNVNSSASMQPETYRLAAFDTLEFKSMITNPHTTIHLQADYEFCAVETNLVWTPYLGWSQGVYEYHIYRKNADGPYVSIGTVSGDITNYIDNTIEVLTDYCYYIKAYNSDAIAASSNQICIHTNSYEKPEYINADYASVVDNAIELSFTIDNSGEVVDYQLLRSMSLNGGYFEIARFANDGQTNIVYVDENVQVDKTHFYYKLAAIDPCGNVSVVSNVASNIILNVSGGDNLYLNHFLEWSAYEAYVGGVEDYKVYRVFSQNAPIALFETDFTDLQYVDNIDTYVNYLHDSKIHVSEKYCYMVEAVENIGNNPYNVLGRSRSNVDCVQHKPLLWMPNVFNPGSYNEINREFTPIISFVPQGQYEFKVFDRYGMEIFSTNNTTQGWNGMLGEERAPYDTYVYYVKFSDFNGDEYLYTGKFLLITE